MRLVAWNCCGKFRTNVRHLLDLNFDIAVVAECGPFDAPLDPARALSWEMIAPLAGGTKHLGVFARQPWSVRLSQLDEHLPWLLAVDVRGPVNFTLLAVWPVAHYGSYTRQTARVIAEVCPLWRVRSFSLVISMLPSRVLSARTPTMFRHWTPPA